MTTRSSGYGERDNCDCELSVTTSPDCVICCGCELFLSSCDLSLSAVDVSSFSLAAIYLSKDQVTRKQIETGRRVSDLYILKSLHIPPSPSSSSCTAVSSFYLDQKSSPFFLWHSRLGHLSSERLKLLVKSGFLGNISVSDIFECNGYKLAKISALPFTRSLSISTSHFQIVHIDLWGPSPIAIKGGSIYYVSFVDDYSRYTWVYLMAHKSDFYKVFRTFHSMVQTQFFTSIKILRSGLGGEYSLSEFIAFLDTHGIIHQSSCSDTPAQNGRAERKQRHLLDTARSLLLSSSVPSVFWGEAVLTAAYLLNRMPTPLLSGRSPYECLHGQVPNYSLLRVFGSSCFVFLPKKDRTKLSARCVLCVFLGYGIHQKGYRCYDPITKKLYVSRHVTFFERLPYFTLPSKAAPVAKKDLIFLDPFPADVSTEEYSSTLDIADIPLPATSPEVSDCPPPPTTSSLPFLIPLAPLVYSRRRVPSPIPSSSSVAPPSDFGNPDPPASRYLTRSRHPPVNFGFTNTCFSSSYRSFLSRIHTYFEPKSYKEACNDPHWVEAMNDELTALLKTQTWELTPLPIGKNLIGYKWVYKVKTHSDGSLEQYKARLVAQGFSQDASVATLKNALLNGHLSEEVYMRPPPRLSPPPGCCSSDWLPAVHDSTMFVRHTSHGLVLLLLYVDDMIITDSDSAAISDVKDHFFREFEMKDLGPLRYFLGIEVASSPKGYLLSQTKYIIDILHRANLTVDTPLKLHAKFSATDGVLLEDPTLYRELGILSESSGADSNDHTFTLVDGTVDTSKTGANTGGCEELLVGDDDGERSVASVEDQLHKEMTVYEKFITGMLTNFGSMALDRIHNTLKIFCVADPRYDKSLQQLQSFLSGLVAEEQLEIRDGMYILKK
ncbi:anaphase-promoting complex/cyclosome 2 [Actinidia rufa]|uniref:Anaphase-promoting complex subunit 2 n=1 Tax=Actinidia rufa TaxID=165716 RepID=A0A7J0DQQ6_9ERIC|nr:anaphase-promoting complex/cyclosome 2 [Actinidia rufa]